MQGVFEGGVIEGEVWRDARGDDAQGGEEEFFAHFAEGEFYERGGHRKNRGAMEKGAEGAHELVLADGGGADCINGTADV